MFTKNTFIKFVNNLKDFMSVIHTVCYEKRIIKMNGENIIDIGQCKIN